MEMIEGRDKGGNLYLVIARSPEGDEAIQKPAKEDCIASSLRYSQ
ncbi:hypothetical protein [Rhodopseudomonas boonkerdii]|nr:hypothetical protein [Rhodopseudomonas boonkerdii]